MKFSPLLLQCLLGVSFAATPPSNPSPLPDVLVTAGAPEALTSPSVETAAEQLRQIPGGASVVDAESYKRGRATTLKDALDFAPGVFIQPRFGAEESRLSIRGSGIQRTFHGRGIKLLQDGVPLNLADGAFDFQAVEPLSARYIEVYRGANALQFGATTIGGAINFVSLAGYDASPFQARFELGSFDSLRAQISSGAVSGPFDYYASLSHSSSNGFRDWSEQNSQRFFANLGYRITDNVETRFYITYVQTDSQLPGALTRAQYAANPQQAAPGSQYPVVPGGSGFQKRDFELFRLASKTTYTDGDHTLSLGAFWSWKNLDHPIFQVVDQLSNDIGLNLSYENKLPLLGHRNEFIVGFAPVYGVTQDQRFLNVSGHRGAQVADYELQALNLDFYLQDRFFLTDTLSLIAGAQVTYANRDLNEERLFAAAPPPVRDNTDRQEFWGFSPKLGLLWDFTPESQIFFNVSRSFEPPSFGELVPFGSSLLALNPQTGTTAELGTRGRKGRFSWDLAYYYTWLEDEMLSLGVPGVPGSTTTVNAGKTVHQGIELALDVELLSGLLTVREGAHDSDRLLLRQTYLWNNFRFDNDTVFGDNQLPGIPEHFYRAELLYEHPCGFYAGPNVEWTPQSYPVDLANSTDAGSFALLGFKIGWRPKKGPSFFIEAKNLTDENYVATTSVFRLATAASAAYFPGDGRSLYAGVEWKW
ncbi:MAG TPA: TonB-dependent receptor [Prosthecobacter sp.]|nr:TonB-dependent receptor [Prosthecobacter sp.]